MPLLADVRSHFSGFSAMQPLTAREGVSIPMVSYHVLSCWAQLVSVFAGCLKILAESDSQVQSSKHGLQLKLKQL